VEIAGPSALFENKECFVEKKMERVFIVAAFINESVGIDMGNTNFCEKESRKT